MLILEGVNEEVGVALDQPLTIVLDESIYLVYTSVSTVVVDPSEQSGVQGIACSLGLITRGGVTAGV